MYETTLERPPTRSADLLIAVHTASKSTIYTIVEKNEETDISLYADASLIPVLYISQYFLQAINYSPSIP
jgi:hypothetical protein